MRQPSNATGTTPPPGAAFYPIYSTGTSTANPSANGHCVWQFGGFNGPKAGDAFKIGIYANDPDLTDDRYNVPFLGTYSGPSTYANSVYNYDGIYTAILCSEKAYLGTCGPLYPHNGGDLNGTAKNHLRSVYWQSY